MKTVAKYPVAIVCIFTWIGFVCAISFMEAWLKFRAPGVTLPIGLGIGRLVFGALNKAEWIFAAAVAGTLLFGKEKIVTPGNLVFLLPIALLLLQTWWLLPALDARASLHIAGQPVPSSPLHLYFIAMEALKVTGLFITGISFFNFSK